VIRSPWRASCSCCVAALALAGCRPSGDGAADAGTIAVFAASSLTEAFRDIETAFEGLHPGVDVRTTFAGSQVLRLQIEQGAVADVFASANLQHMDALVGEGLVEDAGIFALNEMVIIVPADGARRFTSFGDLTRASRIVIGAPTVPAGVYARAVLDRASEARGSAFSDSVLANLVSEEVNVRLVRAKVELGEVDAALVYRTDAVASTRVSIVPIPPEFNVQARYSIARAVDSKVPELAASYLAFVRSGPGQALLERHGFALPAP
jgi:molybdate transport system substrate-binding protein